MQTPTSRSPQESQLELAAQASSGTSHGPERVPLRVALATGYVPPYALPVYQAIASQLQQFSLLLSTPMERNREWEPEWGDLDVRLQKTWTLKKSWRHSVGFRDAGELHVPLDTWSQLRRLRADVIVSEELGFRSLFCSVFTMLRRAPPLALICNLSEHTERGRGRGRLWLRRWLARRASLVMVNGDSGQRYLESIGFDRQQITRFPYVARPGVFETVSLERSRQGPLHLVTCGELTERKGLKPFLQRLSQLSAATPERKIRMTVIGDGPQMRELRQIALPEWLLVVFRGHLNYSEIREIFSQADVFAFPTLADEWGLVVNEALAAGLPVLGSVYSQAVDELIVEGNNGWRFRPDEAAEVESAIVKVLACPHSQFETMGYNCRQSVSERTPQWAANLFVRGLSRLLPKVSDYPKNYSKLEPHQ